MLLDPSQEAAVELGCSAPFVIITGGPGTGKSTTLRVILDRLDARDESYVLASPTGKAAKRMTEATGRAASTIHRLLQWTPLGFTFSHGNPITDADGEPVGAVVIDESSMLDVELASSLVEALDPSTRLILVGDANQLPSVGPGRILADLVESGCVPVARLTSVHRAAAGSWVCRNAPKVLEGLPLELEDCDDFRFVAADDAADVARHVVAIMGRQANAQVLSPQRTTECGVESLNAALQKSLNPPTSGDTEWKIGDRVLRDRDRVIQTVNNYKITAEDGSTGVFNGEVGEVVEVGDLLRVDFGDRVVPYSKGDSIGLDLAYALTVHKSQGSEFDWVVCVVHSAHSYMLTRQLFYTAITRAKKGVFLVGNRKGIAVATSGKKPPPRNTGLVDRIQGIEPGDGDAVEARPAAKVEAKAPEAQAEGEVSW